MKQYKGYYIDHVIFNSKADIDAHIKAQAIESYKRAAELFDTHKTIENAYYIDQLAERLINQFGMTWEEVEAI